MPREREKLAQRLAATHAILGQAVLAGASSLFTDEVVARVAAMLRHHATRLLQLARGEGSQAAVEALMAELVAQPGVVGHVHALALEFVMGERLKARVALDPVAPPLIARLLAGEVAPTGHGWRVLAAQARFVEASRRMEVPPAEIGVELLPERNKAAGAATSPAFRLTAAPAGRDNRQALLREAVRGWDGDRRELLDLARAGIGLFAAALANAVGVERDHVLLAAAGGEERLVAGLLEAAGLALPAVQRQLLCLRLHAALLPERSSAAVVP